MIDDSYRDYSFDILPLHRGFLFSIKARGPSLKSGVRESFFMAVLLERKLLPHP